MMFKQIQWAAVFLGIASIEVALLYKLIAGQAETSQTEMIIAICFVAILFVLSSNVDSLKSISFGKEGFKAELEVLQKKTFENDQAIADLILLSMGPDAYFNLKQIATGNYGPYEKKPHIGLETELYHLRNLGYVVLNREKAQSIHEIPESGDQLSDYIQVTEAGKKYIELREKRALT
jgi:hypothetical protein